MKLPTLKVKKITGLVLSGALLATQSLFAYQPEKNFWSERRRAAQRGSSTLLAYLPQSLPGPTSLAVQFPSPEIHRSSLTSSVVRSVPKTFLTGHADLLAALSPAHGSVRKVSLGKNAGSRGPVVIHIQDVHMNAEAQKNIRETVATLLNSGKVGLVALEGSTEDIALQPFVDFPNRKAVELTADYLLKENKISGPIHAAMTAQGKLPRILGIDDPVHYAANVQAYKDSAPKLEETRMTIRKRRGELEEQKKAVFSPALLALDQTVTGYRNDKVPLGEYMEALVGSYSVVSPFMGRPYLKSFLQALKTERTLDFKQVEAERSRLIEKLTQTLNTQEINQLMAQSLAYRTGELRYGDFYAQLRETCRKRGIRLSDYLAMDEYVRYVLLCAGIDAEQLLNEIASMEKAAYDQLAKTTDEKELVEQSRETWLTSKLVDFALTPSEWGEYKLISNVKITDLGSFESFYREAEARDTAMAKNLLTALDRQSKSGSASPPIALLVTGGFHAEGMAKQLTKKSATVISYVPKIEKVDTSQGSAYLSVFTQEKTPLEKLFQGEKLFLSPDMASAARKMGAPIVAGMNSLVDQELNLSIEKQQALRKFLDETMGAGVDVWVQKSGEDLAKGTVKVSVKIGTKVRIVEIKTGARFEIVSVDGYKPKGPSWFIGQYMKMVARLHTWVGPAAQWIVKFTEAPILRTLPGWTAAQYAWWLVNHSRIKSVSHVVWKLSFLEGTSSEMKGVTPFSGIPFFASIKRLLVQLGTHAGFNLVSPIKATSLPPKKQEKASLANSANAPFPSTRSLFMFFQLLLVGLFGAYMGIEGLRELVSVDLDWPHYVLIGLASVPPVYWALTFLWEFWRWKRPQALIIGFLYISPYFMALPIISFFGAICFLLPWTVFTKVSASMDVVFPALATLVQSIVYWPIPLQVVFLSFGTIAIVELIQAINKSRKKGKARRLYGRAKDLPWETSRADITSIILDSNDLLNAFERLKEEKYIQADSEFHEKEFITFIQESLTFIRTPLAVSSIADKFGLVSEMVEVEGVQFHVVGVSHGNNFVPMPSTIVRAGALAQYARSQDIPVVSESGFSGAFGIWGIDREVQDHHLIPWGRKIKLMLTTILEPPLLGGYWWTTPWHDLRWHPLPRVFPRYDSYGSKTEVVARSGEIAQQARQWARDSQKKEVIVLVGLAHMHQVSHFLQRPPVEFTGERSDTGRIVGNRMNEGDEGAKADLRRAIEAGGLTPDEMKNYESQKALEVILIQKFLRDLFTMDGVIMPPRLELINHTVLNSFLSGLSGQESLSRASGRLNDLLHPYDLDVYEYWGRNNKYQLIVGEIISRSDELSLPNDERFRVLFVDHSNLPDHTGSSPHGTNGTTSNYLNDVRVFVSPSFGAEHFVKKVREIEIKKEGDRTSSERLILQDLAEKTDQEIRSFFYYQVAIHEARHRIDRSVRNIPFEWDGEMVKSAFPHINIDELDEIDLENALAEKSAYLAEWHYSKMKGVMSYFLLIKALNGNSIPHRIAAMSILFDYANFLGIEHGNSIDVKLAKKICDKQRALSDEAPGVVEKFTALDYRNLFYSDISEGLETLDHKSLTILGKATSLWGAKIAEWLGKASGVPNGIRIFGAYYNLHASRIEWIVGLVAGIDAIIATILFSGTSLAWAIAPALGFVGGLLFFASHFILESMRPVTQIRVSPWKAFIMAVIYGVMISVTPYLVGVVPLLEAPRLGVEAAIVLWLLALRLHTSFDQENFRREGEQAARKLVEEMSRVQGAFGAVMPGVQKEHTGQIVGKGSSSPDFMTKTLSRLKTDEEFRAGFLGVVQTAMGDQKLSGATVNLLSAMVMAATGQPLAYVHFLGNSSQEFETLYRLIERPEGKNSSGFSVALVVSQSQRTEYKTMIDLFVARGGAVFSVDLHDQGWTQEALVRLDSEMSPFLAKANGIVATVGEKVGINLTAVAALSPDSKLRTALMNALTLGEVVEIYLQLLRLLASNA